MKLSKKNKDELRNGILELLKEVPEGQLVQIDKDILEGLLFETITVSEENNIQVKLPIWSGEFLSKIDLSEVDFTNVSWSLINFKLTDDDTLGFKYGKDYTRRFQLDKNKQLMQKLQKIKEIILNQFKLTNGYTAWYEGTNAKIDLSKSFEAIHINSISIRRCNFKGLDFSKQDFSNIKKITINYSDLSRTKLPVGNIPLYAAFSDLTEIDLSTKEIDAYQYLFGDCTSLTDCYLTNCKVKITLNVENFKGNKDYIDCLRYAMSKKMVGCYVKGKKVLSQEEKEEIAKNAKTRRQEYEEMKNQILNSTLGNIQEQVSHMKKLKIN